MSLVSAMDEARCNNNIYNARSDHITGGLTFSLEDS